MLAEAERHAPLIRHRALVMQGGSPAFLRALADEFARCDVADATSAHRFADEQFDFVRCGPLSPANEPDVAAQSIGEAIRVLRLLGVAVIDVLEEGSDALTEVTVEPVAYRPGQLCPPPALAVRVIAPAVLRVPAGGTAALTLTLTNLGAAMSPPCTMEHWRIDWLWPCREAPAPQPLLVFGSLTAGDSRSAVLELQAPSRPGSYRGELTVRLVSERPELRSLPALKLAPAVDAVAEPNYSVAEPRETGREMIARAGGVVTATSRPARPPGAVPITRYHVGRS